VRDVRDRVPRALRFQWGQFRHPSKPLAMTEYAKRQRKMKPKQKVPGA